MRKFFAVIFLLVVCRSFSQFKKEAIDSLHSVITGKSHDTDKVQAYISLSSIGVQQSDFGSAISNAKKGLDLASAVKYKRGIAGAANNLASAYYATGKYAEALAQFSLSAKTKEQIGDVKGMARTIGNIGAIYAQQGNYPKALSYYYKSLSLLEKINDKVGMNAPLNNIGLIYYSYKEYHKAGKIFRRLISHYNSNNLPRNNTYIMASVNMGLIHKHEKNFEAAAEAFYEALHWSRKLELPASEALAEDNLGVLWGQMKQLDSAMLHLNRAQDISAKTGDRIHLCVSMLNKANLNFQFGNIQEAEMLALQALSIAQELNALTSTSEAAALLSEISVKKQDYKKALEFHKKYIAARDSVFNEENTKKAVAAEMNFEFEKKEAATKLAMEKEREISKAEKKRQQVVILSVTIGLFLLIILAAVIFYNLQQNKKKNKIISEQKKEVEEKNREIIDSINYARKIQEVMLPSYSQVTEVLPQSFILFKPKDVVSGDFYWYSRKNGRTLIAAADCTGHGVPGALMSMIGNAFLNEIVNEKAITGTADILSELRHKIKYALKQTGEIGESKDGMDMALLSFNSDCSEVEFTGANNPAWIFRKENNDVLFFELAPDKRPVGYYIGKSLPFTSATFNLRKNDTLYLFTDGFSDQFGGENGKKFKTKKLRQFLSEIQELPMREQKEMLENTFHAWKGKHEQVDDVCVIGIRV